VLLFNAASGKLEERQVKVGLANWEYSEITEGLAAGDRIVTSLEKEGIKAGVAVVPDEKARGR
jgi:HlyD family secretion protein